MGTGFFNTSHNIANALSFGLMNHFDPQMAPGAAQQGAYAGVAPTLAGANTGYAANGPGANGMPNTPRSLSSWTGPAVMTTAGT